MTPLERAIKTIGGTKALAQALGLKTSMAISHWKKRQQIPSKHILKITELTGVPSHELLSFPARQSDALQHEQNDTIQDV